MSNERNIEKKFLPSLGNLAGISLETGNEWVNVELSNGYESHFSVSVWSGSYVSSSMGDDMEDTLKDIDTIIDFFEQAKANVLLLKKNLPTKEEHEAKHKKDEFMEEA